MFSSWTLATSLLPHMWPDLVDQTLKTNRRLLFNRREGLIINFQNCMSLSLRLQQTSCSKVKQKTNVESYKGKGGCFWVMLLVFVLCFHWDYEDSACVLAAYVILTGLMGDLILCLTDIQSPLQQWPSWEKTSQPLTLSISAYSNFYQCQTWRHFTC